MKSGMIERLRGSLEVGALVVAVCLAWLAYLVFGEERMNRWLGGGEDGAAKNGRDGDADEAEGRSGHQSGHVRPRTVTDIN